MAINYTYPVKGSPVAADEFLIIDSTDNSTKKVTASSVLSLTDAVATFTAASPLVNVGDAKDVSLTLSTVPVSKGGTGKAGLLESNRSQVLAVNAGRTGYNFVDQQVIETIKAGEALSKGNPLYITGWVDATSIPIVSRAYSSLGSTMPCVGIAADDIAEGEVGEMIVVGVLDGINTNLIPGSPGVGKVVYVGVNGLFTCLKPDEGNLIQNVGIILRTGGGGSGSIQIIAVGRSNDVPNIPSANVWIGSSTQVATPRAFSGDVALSNTGVTTVNSVGGASSATVANGSALGLTSLQQYGGETYNLTQILSLSQTEYDELAPNYDPDALYIIVTP